MAHQPGSDPQFDTDRSDAHPPLTPDQPVFNEPLLPPAALYLAPSEGTPTPRDSYLTNNSAANSAPLLPGVAEKDLDDPDTFSTRKSTPLHRKPLIWALAVVALALVATAVIVPVYFVVIKPKNNTVTGGSGGSNNGTDPNDTPVHQPPTSSNSGGDGSTIKLEDGSEFKYSNPFGGIWVSDPDDPFNDGAYPNSWTPPLNTTWTWGKDKLYGVNLGGWFVLEPFITPALFQKYQPAAVDEWTFSIAMAADTTNGGLSQLEEHYKTFITEKDFAEIAGAGLNWVRIPIPFWAIETWGNEPFMARTCWQYILKALGWARKYGLRVKIDLHTIPGSQNGLNHSGKVQAGAPNLLNGVMGVANAERALNYIRIFGEFFAQQEYSNLVCIFGIMNEPLQSVIGKDSLTSFYIQAHNILREVTGIGKGFYIAIGDGFAGIQNWAGYLPGSDRLILDSHPYFAFDGGANNEPITASGPDGRPGGIWPQRACERWAHQLLDSQSAFGVNIAGEFSNGFNDCAFWLRGPANTETMNPDCAFWTNSAAWNDTVKEGLKNFGLASMDALMYPFFWTWKIGPTAAGNIEAPLWSYKLGLDNGWVSKDPRDSVGRCKDLGAPNDFNGQYQGYATGSSGGLIPSSVIASWPWPPASISNAAGPASQLPMYTPTGTIVTLPPPSNTGKVRGIDGWANSQDTAPAPTPIESCTYPDAYSTSGVVPAGGCWTIQAAPPTPSSTSTPTPTTRSTSATTSTSIPIITPGPP